MSVIFIIIIINFIIIIIIVVVVWILMQCEKGRPRRYTPTTYSFLPIATTTSTITLAQEVVDDDERQTDYIPRSTEALLLLLPVCQLPQLMMMNNERLRGAAVDRRKCS